jgi:hypothetical protein
MRRADHFLHYKQLINQLRDTKKLLVVQHQQFCAILKKNQLINAQY